MDAASNNAVEDVRALRERVGYAPVRSPHRIWIVDEVHMLTLPAFNAFLKTLEEPPEAVKFLFCTTEEHKLPDTFRSRCQRVEFRPIGVEQMAARLEDLAGREGARLAPGLAALIARSALGGLRDAESTLEQLISGAGEEVLTEADLDALCGRAPAVLLDRLLEAVDARDAGRSVDAVDACLAAGSKPGVLLDQWLDRLRDRLVAAARAPADPRAGAPSVARLARAIDLLLAKRAHLKSGADGSLVAQVAAIELARLPDARDLDAILASLRAGPAPSAPTPPASAASSAAPAPLAVPEARAGPTAASEPPPRAAPGDLATPETLEARWAQLAAAAGQRDPRLGEALAAARPLALDGDRVRVVLAPEAEPLRQALMRRDMRLAFGQVARERWGRFLHLALADDAAPPAVEAQIAPDLRALPAVRRVAERTKGRVIHVERVAAAGAERGAAGPGAAATPEPDRDEPD
jgi:DNA polymerase-3 subunit gamma/tau